MWDLVDIHSWLTMTWSHLHQGWNKIAYSNERRQVTSTACLLVMRDGVDSNSLLGLPSFGDIFGHYYTFCMGLGFSALQANGRSIFVTQGKALWEQCSMPFAVSGSMHFGSFDIARSGLAPTLDLDKMFNELWWLNDCFCNGIGISAVGNPCLGGELVNNCCYIRCEMTDEGDPFCSGICACLSTVKMFSELWWLTSCFYESFGSGAVGNPILGGEDVNICWHSIYVMIDVGDTPCSNVRVCLCIIDQCSLPPSTGFPICVCSHQSMQVNGSTKRCFDLCH